MDWRDLQTFLSTAEAGSTQAASKTLGLDQSTISRRIAGFEKQIGQRLFERLPSGLVLTPAGEQMLSTARRIEESILTMERRLIGEDPDIHGEIRLTVPPFAMEHFLGDILARFHAQHPDVHLDIDVSMTEANLTKREADIAVRGSNTPPEHLIGRRAATYHVATYVRRDRADRGFDQAWIGWGEEGELEAWNNQHDLPTTATLWRADSMSAQLGLARAGLGLAVLPCQVGDRDPELVRLDPARTWPSRDIWVLTHRDLIASPRIRTLFNFLADEIKTLDSLFTGADVMATSA